MNYKHKTYRRQIGPKPSCRRCFGRGIAWVDTITKQPVICDCVKWRDVRAEFTNILSECFGIYGKLGAGYQARKGDLFWVR